MNVKAIALYQPMIRFSVIIPTLNQSAKLNVCLAHLAKLDYDPHAIELLVIDNGSTDDTKTVTESYAGTIKNLQYHYCAEIGLMAARHKGCEEARGDILCYLDDDSLVTKDWLQGMVESFNRDDVVIAGGPCIPKYEAPPPAWLQYFWDETAYGKTHGYLSLIDFGNNYKMIPPCYIYGCNFAVRKSVFLDNGGTLPDYYPRGMYQYIGTGESGLTLKLERKGFLAAYNPKARIDHFIPSSRLTLEYFCWRRYYNGIHSSYDEVRTRHGLIESQAPPLQSLPQASCISANIRRLPRRITRAVERLLKRVGLLSVKPPVERIPDPPDVVAMKEKIEESYRAGYAFHQEALARDPKLLEWVLRPNYLAQNGTLPK